MTLQIATPHEAVRLIIPVVIDEKYSITYNDDKISNSSIGGDVNN